MSVTELEPSVLMFSLYFVPTEPGLLQTATIIIILLLLVLFEYQVLLLFHLLYLYNQPLRLGGGSGQDLQRKKGRAKN